MNFALVAVADPDRQYAQIASRIFADNKARIFIDGKDLLENSDVDAVIIASPNYVHCESAVLAMQRGVKFLLEKPVAASLEDMATMWQTQLQTGAAPVIGFCIRYTPFYKKVHEIASSGSLGKILAVNAEELMSDDLSVVFARGDWRPDHTKSGGLMAEKCSHDMDILNWIAGTEAETVSSFAARTFLTPRSDAGERCSKCNIADTCRFKHGLVPEIFETHWPPELHDVLTKVSDDTCVFSPHHTYPDHQSLNIQYKNGVISTFTVAQCQPATRRTIHVIGSDARLYGVVNDNRISVYRHGRLSEERVEVIEVNPDASGHNGGDSVLTRDFFALLEGQPNRSRPGLREGIEASLLSIAADQSALIGRPMSLDRLREKVFKTSGPLRQVQNPAPLSVVQS
jgi:predicted dehydrogenase